MENKSMSSTTKGLILGLIMVVISLAMYLLITDVTKMQGYNWVTYVLIIAGIVWACFSYAKDMNGNVTFGNVFSHGFKTTAVLTIIVLAYTVLALTILFPEMKDKFIDIARTQMEKEGKLNDAQIDQAIGMTQKFFMPFAIGGVIITYLFIGALGSLLGAAISKKNPEPQPFH